jgi:hypothetical protein
MILLSICQTCKYSNLDFLNSFAAGRRTFMPSRSVCVGEGGQGGVSRRLSPNDDVGKSFSNYGIPIAAAVGWFFADTKDICPRAPRATDVATISSPFSGAGALRVVYAPPDCDFLSFLPPNRDISMGYGDPFRKNFSRRSGEGVNPAARPTSGLMRLAHGPHWLGSYHGFRLFQRHCRRRTLQKSESCDSLGFSKRMIRS